MSKKVSVLYLLIFALAMLAPLYVHAQASPSPTPQVESLDLNVQVAAAAQDFLAGKIAAGAAVIVLIAVYLFRQYLMPKLKVSSAILPWISVGLGVIISVATAMAAGAPGLVALKAAVLAGPLASQLWSMILKNILHTA